MSGVEVTVRGQRVSIEDTVCECFHWYDEHVDGACEGCWQVIEPQGSFGSDADLVRTLGFGHEHEFRFSEAHSTPEAIADRGGDPEAWPEHVKRHFDTEQEDS